jgi:hypothetical protein
MSPTSQSFVLREFADSSSSLDCTVSGQIERRGSIVQLQYQLNGAHLVQIPAATEPDRRFDLWEATCFEWFVGIPGAIDYWEFNLAPSGQWNCFYLSDYRQGLIEEPRIGQLPFHVARDADRLTLDLILDLAPLIAAEQPIEVAITTVLQTIAGDLHYLALHHGGSEADFHRRDGFQIQL